MKYVAKLAVAAAAVLALAIPGSALAAEPVPGDQPGEFTLGKVSILGPVHIRGDQARVHVKYTCPASDNHLWVSVKQSADGSLVPDIGNPESGGSGVATNWWMSHANSFSCDGNQHVAWFTVDGAEVSTFRDPGTLVRGQGFVQVCFTSDEGGPGDLNPNWVIIQKWVKVV